MKKKVLVTAILGVVTIGLLTGCGSQADVSTEADEDNVIVQDSEDADTEETDTEENDTEEVTEDPAETEKLKRKTWYDANGETITSYTEYEYDDEGNCIKYTKYDADGAVTSYSEYEYDETGTYTESTYSSDGALTDESVYDEAGNLLKETTDDFLHEYEYDEAGNLLMVNSSSSTYDYYFETNFTYEEYNALGKGTKVSWITIDKNGETIDVGVEEHEFDEQGNHIRTLDEDGTVLYEYEYDEHGNLISSSDSNGYLDIYRYEYDSAGREIKRIVCDSDGNISSWCEYEYGSLN
jgi:YD repeat-containing protein